MDDSSLSYFVYILKCRTGQLYTGYTNNIKRRVVEHKNGTASKFTRSRLPVILVYQEQCRSRIHALKREAQIKKISRKKKLELVLVNIQENDN